MNPKQKKNESKKSSYSFMDLTIQWALWLFKSIEYAQLAKFSNNICYYSECLRFLHETKIRVERGGWGENGRNAKGNCYHCIPSLVIDNNRRNIIVVVNKNQPCHIGCIIDTRCLVCLHIINLFITTAVKYVAHPMIPLTMLPLNKMLRTFSAARRLMNLHRQ